MSGLPSIVAFLMALPTQAAAPLSGFPFTDEGLNYKITALNSAKLGTVHMSAHRADPGWSFELTIDAGLPAFPIKDRYSSRTNGDFCTTEFTKDFTHGSKHSVEKETIDRSIETATRKTVPNGGGESTFSVPDCVKDGLALFFYARQQFGQGRVPASQSFLFGAMYDINLAYGGEQTIRVGEKPTVTDELLCAVKGPSSSFQFEVYFARDAARTPLLIKVPLAAGSISLELVR